MRTYPETAGLRYLAPPLAVLGVGGGLVLALVGAVTGSRLLGVAGLAPLAYAGLVVGGSLAAGGGMPWRARAWLPVVIGTMHMAWGAGFLRGVAGDDARVAAERVYPESARAQAARRTTTRPATED